MTRVAFVGVGDMGGRMARRLLDAGHTLVVWNRTEARTNALVEHGAEAAGSPADAASRAEVVLTMVADPTALRAVVEGPGGIAAGIGRATLIEMSTVGPAAVSRVAAALPEGAVMLDAPVLGSLAEAEAGSLRIFVGGDAELAGRWTPLLSVLGRPTHVGPLGAGAAAKLVANSTLFGTLGVLGEALALADGLGLTREAAFAVLGATPLAAQADRRREAIESGSFPARFRLSLARKDADLVVEAATAAGLDLRLAKEARRLLAEAEAAGRGDEDYAAVLAEILRRARSASRRRGR